MATKFLMGPMLAANTNVGGANSFMLVSLLGGIPQFLNSSGTGPFNYFWDTNVQAGINLSNLPVFLASGTTDNLVLSDNFNGGFLTLAGSNNLVVNTKNKKSVALTQTLYAPFWPPDIFLSGAVYVLSGAAGNTGIANIYTSSTLTTTALATNLYLLPINWFFPDPNIKGQIDKTSSPQESLFNWLCKVQSSNQACVNANYPNLNEFAPANSWTTYQEAVDNFPYNYCLAAQTCGTNNCNGPCSAIYYDCVFDSSNQKYGCVFNPENYFFDAQWWFSPYFIGAMIALLVIIILITLVLFFLAKKVKTKYDSENKT